MPIYGNGKQIRDWLYFDDHARALLHVAPTGEISWYNFTKEIFKLAKIDCKVSPITTEQYSTPAKRPKNTLMNKDKIAKAFSADTSDWKMSLSTCVIELSL